METSHVILFYVLWVVFAIVLCIVYDKIFPKRKLKHKTKGYLEKDVWMYDKEWGRKKNRLTYRFTIDGKEYKKTFNLSGPADYEIDIVYNKGYLDAQPANTVYDIDPRICIKVLLCAFLAPAISRIIVKFFMG